MDYSKLQAQANKLHRTAKNGTIKHDKITYVLTFNHYMGHYEVTDETGEVLHRFNTRKITEAKKWLREWL